MEGKTRGDEQDVKKEGQRGRGRSKGQKGPHRIAPAAHHEGEEGVVGGKYLVRQEATKSLSDGSHGQGEGTQMWQRSL